MKSPTVCRDIRHSQKVRRADHTHWGRITSAATRPSTNAGPLYHSVALAIPVALALPIPITAMVMVPISISSIAAA